MSGPVRQYAVHQLWRNATTAESLQEEVVVCFCFVFFFLFFEEKATTEWLGGIAFLSAQPTLTLQLPAPFETLFAAMFSPAGPYIWHIVPEEGRGGMPIHRLHRLL